MTVILFQTEIDRKTKGLLKESFKQFLGKVTVALVKAL